MTASATCERVEEGRVCGARAAWKVRRFALLDGAHLGDAESEFACSAHLSAACDPDGRNVVVGARP